MANSVMATPGGHIGVGASSRANAVKDPRDPRPRVVRDRLAQDIVDFCELRQHSVMIRELLQPTGTQFYNIFKYLVMQYAGIKFGEMLGPKGKPEDEVLAILRACQYPFADSISKSHLQAVGSAQSWPNMLAMLHWFVEMMNVSSPPPPPPPSVSQSNGERSNTVPRIRLRVLPRDPHPRARVSRSVGRRRDRSRRHHAARLARPSREGVRSLPQRRGRTPRAGQCRQSDRFPRRRRSAARCHRCVFTGTLGSLKGLQLIVRVVAPHRGIVECSTTTTRSDPCRALEPRCAMG